MQLLRRRLPRTTSPMILVLTKRRSRSKRRSSLPTVKTILSIVHQLMYGITLRQPMDMMRQAMATKQNSSIQLSL
ncbi:hypothetical protein VN97_g6968 [Penicillium thymicola]|uniref:Uncharacterized protein n=1 Tax=Penicillium thymicola TaxID=293382 RepID=A0AAI9TFY0_PENTH|nr:hypothetical protein VN97_g6968 [Penicillium thymicola]